MTLITSVFPILKTVKDVVRKMYKEPRLRTVINSHHVKGSQTLPKPEQQHFYHIFITQKKI